MYESYDRAVVIGKNYTRINNKSPTMNCNFSMGCEDFRKYMVQNHLSFSKTNYLKWLSYGKSKWNHYKYVLYRRSIYILDDIITNGYVTTVNFTYEGTLAYCNLSIFSKKLYDDYTTKKSVHYSIKTFKNCLQSIKILLNYFDKNKIDDYSKITHKLVRNFYNSGIIKPTNQGYWSCIRSFLIFLKENKYISFHLNLSIDKNYSTKILFVDKISTTWAYKFHFFIAKTNKSYTSKMKIYDKACSEGFKFYKEQKYSYRRLALYNHTIIEFKIFMEANNLLFSKKLIDTWLNYFFNQNKQIEYVAKRRILYLVEYISRGNPPKRFSIIKPNIIYKYVIPEWSKPLLASFLKEEKENGLVKSTIRGYKSDCTVFLAYLKKIKLNSIENLNAQIIKDFQKQDKHLNPKAKNRCSSSIRQFLKFLVRFKYIPDYLILALSCENAPSEDLVTVLSKNQLNSIEKYKNIKDFRAIEDLAIVLLGLELGFRMIDVINLKIENISFEKQEISIIQQKTGIPIRLPFPTELGNYLFQYLTEIRPKSTKSFVFILKQVPFSKIAAGRCNSALYRCIDSSNEKATFHCLRRTYASKLSLAHNPTSTIVAALGHSDDSSLNKYLLLDSERMRMCSIGLQGIEYTGELL